MTCSLVCLWWHSSLIRTTSKTSKTGFHSAFLYLNKMISSPCELSPQLAHCTCLYITHIFAARTEGFYHSSPVLHLHFLNSLLTLAGVRLALPPHGRELSGAALQHWCVYVPRHDGAGAGVLCGSGSVLGAACCRQRAVWGPVVPDDRPEGSGQCLHVGTSAAAWKIWHYRGQYIWKCQYAMPYPVLIQYHKLSAGCYMVWPGMKLLLLLTSDPAAFPKSFVPQHCGDLLRQVRRINQL